MKTNHSLENIGTTERYLRFGASIAAIVATMESQVGGGAFTAINLAAIVLATTAITGWDPFRSAASYVKSLLKIDVAQPTALQGR